MHKNVEGEAPVWTTKGEIKMAKKVVGKIKLQIEAGKANPSPPVGPALGQHGVNIMDFCKQFNAKTQDKAGYIIPVIIDVYEDRSFTFVIKSPPAPVLIKKALNIPKGSGVPNKTNVFCTISTTCIFLAIVCSNSKQSLEIYM